MGQIVGALRVAAQGEAIPSQMLDALTVVGELSLDGAVRPVRGVLPMAVGARMIREVGGLLRRARAVEKRLPTFSLDTEIRFRSAASSPAASSSSCA